MNHLPKHISPLILGFAGFFLLSSCTPTQTNAPQPKSAFPQSITLLEGKSAKIADTSQVVQFDKLISDSRCPTNAVCVWEGDAVLALSVSTPGTEAPVQLLELHTYDFGGRNQASAYGYQFKILELTPKGTRPATVTLEVSSALGSKL
jgi:hypothetical protein